MTTAPRHLALPLVLVAVLATGCSAADPQPRTAAAPAAAQAADPSPVAAAVASAELVTQRVPRDPSAWTALATAALEAGRASGDPALYARAREAAERSLAVQPDGNDAALAVQAMLADADHDFARARALAEQALAVNPQSVVALSALTDALTGLGRLDEALAAARRLDATEPGVASFTRLSYQAELRGDLPRARDLMERAAQSAGSASELAFARTQAGLLALAAGDVDAAAAQWRLGQVAAPDDAGLARLDARIALARNDLRGAADRYARLVARTPSPQNAGEQADVLARLGDADGAEAAAAVARAGYALQDRAGVLPEGTQVLFEADHGDPVAAVALGQEVWRRSPTADHADALAWALHRAGRDAEALTWSERALASGGTPLHREHRAAILAARR